MIETSAIACACIALTLALATSVGLLIRKRFLIRAITSGPVFAGWACLAFAITDHPWRAMNWLVLTCLYLFLARSIERQFLKEDDR